MSLSKDVVVSSMSLISRLGGTGQLEASGVSKADFNKLVGDEPWLGSDRNRMTSVLHTLLMGSIDALGLPRFPLPAEFMAAGICVFVSPVNVHAACRFVAETRDAESLASQTGTQQIGLPEAVKPEKIFALVCMMYDDPRRAICRSQFEKQTGLQLDKVLQKKIVDFFIFFRYFLIIGDAYENNFSWPQA